MKQLALGLVFLAGCRSAGEAEQIHSPRLLIDLVLVRASAGAVNPSVETLDKHSFDRRLKNILMRDPGRLVFTHREAKTLQDALSIAEWTELPYVRDYNVEIPGNSCTPLLDTVRHGFAISVSVAAEPAGGRLLTATASLKTLVQPLQEFRTTIGQVGEIAFQVPEITEVNWQGTAISLAPTSGGFVVRGLQYRPPLAAATGDEAVDLWCRVRDHDPTAGQTSDKALPWLWAQRK